MLHISRVVVLLHNLISQGIGLILFLGNQSRLARGRDAAVIHKIVFSFMQCNHFLKLLFTFSS